MIAEKCGTKYGAADLERVFESGKHHSGSADIKLLDRFLGPLSKGELDDEAVIVYGMHLEQCDVKYIAPWVNAMVAIVSRNPEMLSKVRLRPTLNYHRIVSDTKQTTIALRWFMARVANDIRGDYDPVHDTNEQLLKLLQQLDQPG